MTTSQTSLGIITVLSAMVLGSGSIGCGSSDSSDEEAMDDTSASELRDGADFKCPGYEKKDCVCNDSTFNCELPNDQAGRNRFLTLSGDQTWGLKPGTPMVDGENNFRGNVKSTKIAINFGQRKSLAGSSHVFAFGAALDNGMTASSWVPESSLDVGKLVRMPTIAGRNPNKGDYATTFTLKGGVAAHLVGLKVVPDSQSVDHEAATDYLERPGGEIYVLYCLPGVGGVATDAFPVGTKFLRAKGVRALYINLYPPKSTKVVGKMRFVYGHVNGRYGWIASDAIQG